MSETQLSPVAVQDPSPSAAQPAQSSGGRVAALVIGAVLALAALALLAGGITGLWADLTQREAGYVTTDVHEFSTSGSALATKPTHLGSPGVGWLYSPGMLGKIRIRVTPVSAGPALFVGIGRSRDVDRYLRGVGHTIISDYFENKVEAAGGGRARSAPTTQRFWAAASTGPGPRTVEWDPHGGSWTVVVMNADGRPGVDARTDLGARLPAVLWISVGLLIGSTVFLAGGGLLIAGATRSGRADDATHDYEGRSDAER